MQTTTFQVSGMTCQGCARGLAKALKALPGVANAEVSLDAAEATVTFDPAHVSIAQLRAALEKAGYGTG